MVLCIMHIYAHILAAEDDEAGRRGFHKLREPYLCKCSGIRVTACAIFLADLPFDKLTSLEFRLGSSMRYEKRDCEGRREGTRAEEETKKIKRDKQRNR